MCKCTSANASNNTSANASTSTSASSLAMQALLVLSMDEEHNSFHLNICDAALGEPTATRSAVFLNIVQNAFDPPPFVLNIMLQIFFDGFLKKRVNVCRDIIWQNNA